MPTRRQFAGHLLTAGVGALAARDALAQPAGGAARPTVLAIGAHYDDCPFGIPGILLQAVARGNRVVVLSLIGDYSNWKPVRGRGADLVDGTRRVNADYGIESRFLGFASGRIADDEAARRAVADVVAETRPDVAFVLWPRDQHPDHEAAATLSKLALHLGDRVLADPFAPYATPRRAYQFDNGPRHTIGFVPDTFVDVTREWPRAIEWLGRLMAVTRNEPYAAGALDGAQRLKESLARYRGATCGVTYAEALAAVNAYPQVLF
ncbi:PIG-L deacetylase family protein [Luteitalea sp. TBR-22]|uniref:PIG-L deacetylase family protein n=1 Tax=Luteitalea sp. TBR-22 TaxID=2802971 RepID=UPI001EF6F3EC|nr:PIG-L family deacetylase [Luteitalea sp. TBR-22]